ncbi:MAG: GNAT family N-acetyltransferase [Parcubacteria group bacterium]|nr:GNAT family N-acetyltransferase [Parcubacteria group bacterium]
MEPCFQVRRSVFQNEQGVARDMDEDGHDTDSGTVHFTASTCLWTPCEQCIGTVRGRVLSGKSGFKLERMAVLREYRSRSVGTQLLDAFMSYARDRARLSLARRVILHAQESARGFYERAGFTVTGDAFFEAGILHYPMERQLTRRVCNASGNNDGLDRNAYPVRVRSASC